MPPCVDSMLAATEEGLCEIRLLLLIDIASHHSFMFYVSFSSNPLLLKSLFENVNGKEEKLISSQVSSPLARRKT